MSSQSIITGSENEKTCSVCNGISHESLAQIPELFESAANCPGCSFLSGLIRVIFNDFYHATTVKANTLILTNWNLWGREHFVTIGEANLQPLEQWQVPTLSTEADHFEVYHEPGRSSTRVRITRSLG